MQKPEITVDDLRKLLIMTIREDVQNRRIGKDIDGLTEHLVKDALFASFCRNLDYFDIEYDVDEMWAQFTQLVGDCALIALTQIGVEGNRVYRHPRAA